jgi:Aminoglycoside-2''-adenylyltransferase
VPDTNEVQLGLIQEVGGVLGQAKIRWWLRGGWAIDFHLGRVTRRHDDVDLVTWLRHRGRIRRLLLAAGFREVGGYRPPQLVVEKFGEEVSFLFITRHDRQIVVPGYESWPFRPGVFSRRTACFRGVQARLVSARELLAEKQEYHEWSGRPLRSKDHDSIVLLQTIIRS